MPKYKISCGSLVTKLMQRTFTVSAPDEQTAIEKAENRFMYECRRQKYTEVGGAIELNYIEKVE